MKELSMDAAVLWATRIVEKGQRRDDTALNSALALACYGLGFNVTREKAVEALERLKKVLKGRQT